MAGLGWTSLDRADENIHEVGKGVTSATALSINDLTRYISAT